MVSEQLNDVSSINNMAFNLFIHRIYCMLQYFSGHLNGQNNFFLVLCDAYIYTVPLLVRTINSSKIIVRTNNGTVYTYTSHRTKKKLFCPFKCPLKYCNMKYIRCINKLNTVLLIQLTSLNCSEIILYFFFFPLVWPPRFQSLLIMGWCSSKT